MERPVANMTGPIRGKINPPRLILLHAVEMLGQSTDIGCFSGGVIACKYGYHSATCKRGEKEASMSFVEGPKEFDASRQVGARWARCLPQL
jgi:hypothetical protein